MMEHPMYMASAMGWWAAVIFVACLALIALLAIVTVRLDRPWDHLADPASRILDQRFARGEIDRKDYLERRALLR